MSQKRLEVMFLTTSKQNITKPCTPTACRNLISVHGSSSFCHKHLDRLVSWNLSLEDKLLAFPGVYSWLLHCGSFFFKCTQLYWGRMCTAQCVIHSRSGSLKLMRKSLSRKECPAEVYLMPKEREDMGNLELGNFRQRVTAADRTPRPDEPQKREQQRAWWASFRHGQCFKKAD